MNQELSQDNNILVVFIFIAVFTSVLIITKSFFKIKIEEFDTYSSTPTLLKKMRLLSTLTLLVVPMIAFYESEALHLYQTNWPIVIIIALLSAIVLLISFTVQLTSKTINTIIAAYYVLVISLVYLIAFQKDLYITILTEAAVLLIFSKVIFQKLRYIIYFFIYIYIFLIVLGLSFSSYESVNFSFFISTLIMFTMATAAIIIVESSSISNLSFSNKILKYSDLLVLVSDVEGDIVYVSKPLKDLVKRSENELLNKGWWEFSMGENYSLEKIRNDLSTTFEIGVKPSYVNQLLIEGTTHEIEWKDFSLENKFIMSVGKDVTEELVNQDQIKQLSYVAQNTENAVIILDLSFNIEWVNSAFTEIFGYALIEVLGKNPGDLLNGPRTNQGTLKRIETNIKLRQHVEEEILNYDKFGNEKWILVSMDPIYNDEKELIKYVAIENDVTERKLKDVIIEEQRDSIVDSLNYASIIQTATLPTKEDIELVNKDVAIYYKPKEIIGGDFYLVDSNISEEGHLLEIYIVADCTGHGVPGAMLSVLCLSLLKEAIRNSEIKNPAQALTFTRNKLVEIFNSSGDYSLNDGMDMGMCVVNRTSGILEYSGANRPLFLIQNNELVVVNGDKQSVGHNHLMEDFTFTTHSFSEGDLLYLFSDGVVDQFGGPKHKKFMTSRFKKLINDTRGKTVKAQIAKIKSELNDWEGDKEQTDDICLMGVRL